MLADPGGELVLEFRDEYAGFGRHRRSDPGGRGDGRRRPRTHTATDPGHGTSRIAAGAAIGCGFAVAGLFVGRLFSPNPHVQLLVAAGMVTMGAFLPLQGWMMALDAY